MAERHSPEEERKASRRSLSLVSQLHRLPPDKRRQEAARLLGEGLLRVLAGADTPPDDDAPAVSHKRSA